MDLCACTQDKRRVLIQRSNKVKGPLVGPHRVNIPIQKKQRPPTTNTGDCNHHHHWTPQGDRWGLQQAASEYRPTKSSSPTHQLCSAHVSWLSASNLIRSAISQSPEPKKPRPATTSSASDSDQQTLFPDHCTQLEPKYRREPPATPT